MGISLGGRQPNGMETGIRQAWRRTILTAVNDCRECALGWEIVFTAVALMAILVSDIGDSQDGLGVKLTLDAYAVLVARRQLVIINSKAVMSAGLIGRFARFPV